MKKVAAGLVALFFLAIVVIEITLRVYGYQPYQYIPAKFITKPGMMYGFDSLLGHRLVSGSYSIEDESGKWKATHLQNGYRITSNTSDSSKRALASILFIGGATTYGQFMDDYETYPFLLQQKLPNYHVQNMAVPGYGLVHVYVQLQKELVSIDSGDVVLYTYFSRHDNRPTRAVEKQMYASIKEGILPGYHYIKMDTALQVSLYEYTYRPWPLASFSATVNTIEDVYNDYIDEHTLANYTARKAILQMNELCRKKGAKLVLVVRKSDEETKRTVQYCAESGVMAVDFSAIQIASSTDSDIKARPGEHLNAGANRQFAEQLYSYLLQEKLVDTTGNRY